MKVFSQNLRYLRKTAHMSQEELANEVGLNRGNIASYEKGSALPSIAKMIELARLFNVNIIDLYESSLEETPMYKGKDGVLYSIEMLNGNGHEKSTSAEIANKKLHKNVESFKDALHGFKDLHQGEFSSFKLISREMNNLSREYERLVGLVERLVETNAILLDKLVVTEKEEVEVM